MAEAYLHNHGDALDYTPSGADAAAGEIVNLGSGLVGVVVADTTDGTLGAVQVRGLFKVSKTAAVAFAAGEQVDWEESTNLAVTAGGDFRLGVAAYAAAGADSYVYVILNRNVADAAAV